MHILIIKQVKLFERCVFMIISNNFVGIKPYKVKNMIFKQLNAELERPTEETQPADVGYLRVSVYTASGALPVPNAVITVYDIHEDGEEHVFYHLVTDKSGNAPIMELPVAHEEKEYEFTKYNLRVQAIGYYTINILDIRIFPDVTTSFRINLIPTAQGTTEEESQTVVIPETPLDITN